MPDVPIERDRIGAMGLSQVASDYEFKPYVYRGTGEDQYPEWDLDLLPKPTPKPKPVAVDAETYRRREVVRIKYAAKRAREDRWFLQRMAEREAERQRREAERFQKLRVPLPEIDRYEPPEIVPVRKIRAASGWKPLTGADLEHLLEED